MLQQIVTDVLDTLKLIMRNFHFRKKHIWVHSVKAVHIADKPESLDPLIRTEQVKICRADEIDWGFVLVKKSSDIGYTFQAS
jgi:hypothetical protein